jgi:hypothetical protein
MQRRHPGLQWGVYAGADHPLPVPDSIVRDLIGTAAA